MDKRGGRRIYEEWQKELAFLRGYCFPGIFFRAPRESAPKKDSLNTQAERARTNEKRLTQSREGSARLFFAPLREFVVFSALNLLFEGYTKTVEQEIAADWPNHISS